MKIIVVFCVGIVGVLSAPPTYNKYNLGKPTYNNQYIPPANKYNPSVAQPTLNKYNQNAASPTLNKFSQNAASPTLNKYNQNAASPTLNKFSQNVASSTLNKMNKKPAVSTYNQYNRSDDEKNKDKEATIVRYESTNDGQGNYEFEYETSDGQIRKERGELIQVDGAEEPVIKVTGTYTYRDPENRSHTVNYVADADGYRSMEEATRQKIVPQTVSAFQKPLGILGAVSKTLG
ncbi:uncharacterized protein LOC123299390 [Chrysoperla carnea]|uniref:uncharacterized protein LOC123299390 n=1 Tax=Chrysoperla carnea TaxID=189513 RepID=UPI001D06174C|nr:uncharacterized protein LOC123299390 [Chrysoperla carnea]